MIRRQLHVLGHDHRRGMQSEGDESRAEPVRVGELHAPRIVHVDHRVGALLHLPQSAEQLRLGGEILLHRLVIVQVVLREVGEHADIVVDAPHALLVQPVRRNLHHGAAATGLQHPVQHRLDVRRFRRRARGGNAALPDFITNGADEPRRTPRRVQDVASHERRGRLPVRPGNADHLQPARRFLVERAGDFGEGLPRILDHDGGHVPAGPSVGIRHDRHRAALQRVRNEIGALLPMSVQRDKQVSRPDLPRIVGQAFDFTALRPFHRHGLHHFRYVFKPHCLRTQLSEDHDPSSYRLPAAFPRSMAARPDGADGSTFRYRTACAAISRKTGAATAPPVRSGCGSSTTTIMPISG